LPSDLSRKILKQARAQLQEDDDADNDVDDKVDEDFDDDDNDDDDNNNFDLDKNNTRAADDDDDDDDDDEAVSRSARRSAAQRTRVREKQIPLNQTIGRSIQLNDNDNDDDDNDDDVDNEDDADDDDDANGALGGLSAEDQAAMELFMAPRKAAAQSKHQQAPARMTLGDIIMAKLREHNEALQVEDVDDTVHNRLNPKVHKIYAEVGVFMRTYRSGPLPKAFSLIPTLSNWEEVLWVTQPQSWSPNAVLKATTIFANVPQEKMTQRFYALVLLARVRDEVQQTRKATPQVYQAIRKAAYKPGAFFKGLVLPLAEDPDCSIREAFAFTTVLKRARFPLLHSAAALMKLCEMPYTLASAMFLRCLIMKRYALPYKTVDALFVHFMSFLNETQRMPNLWHECLLVYAERYKTDLEPEQKEALKALLRVHSHFKITPAIRRELYQSECRNGAPPVVDDIDDDTVGADGLTPAQRLAARLQQATANNTADMDEE
jgi:essential nuclear protein 1